MARLKGTPKSGGRRKGTPNKVGASIKRLTLQALSNVGGSEYLEEQARENPVAFMSLLGRILPTQLIAEVNVNTKTFEINLLGLDLPQAIPQQTIKTIQGETIK